MKTVVKVSVLLSVITLAACNNDEMTSLKLENKILNEQLTTHLALKKTLLELDAALDTIPRFAGSITPADASPASKLALVHQLIQSQRTQLAKIQRQLTIARNESEAYLMLVDAMRSEVEIRDQEIAILEQSLASTNAEKKSLADFTQKQNEMLASLKQEVLTRDLNLRSQSEITDSQKLTEADLCYRQAILLEASANKIKFSPARKKETLKEALELFKKALYLGKKEAMTGIVRLREKTADRNFIVTL